MSAPLPEDKRAGFTGLIVALAFLLAVVYGITMMTNAKYSASGHSKAAPAAAH
jgi:hypothetical protein